MAPFGLSELWDHRDALAVHLHRRRARLHRVPRQPVRAAEAKAHPTCRHPLSGCLSPLAPWHIGAILHVAGGSERGGTAAALRHRAARGLHGDQPRRRSPSSTSPFPRCRSAWAAFAGDIIVGGAYIVGDDRPAHRRRPQPEQRRGRLGGGERRTLSFPPEHARQHLGGHRASARRLDPRWGLDPARQRQAGQGGRDPLATHRCRDGQLGHGHRPERNAPRTEHRPPRQARGEAAAAPLVGVLQR